MAARAHRFSRAVVIVFEQPSVNSAVGVTGGCGPSERGRVARRVDGVEQALGEIDGRGSRIPRKDAQKGAPHIYNLVFVVRDQAAPGDTVTLQWTNTGRGNNQLHAAAVE